MKSYQVCNRCVMDTSVSDIDFDEQGICNYCKAADERLKKELFANETNSDKLTSIIEKIKQDGSGKPYDCIIGVSGGVDSSYVAYLAKKKLGLRPLAVHFDNGWNSELAVQNIETLLNELDIDLYTHVVNWDEFRDLQLSFLKASVANCEIPTDHAIVSLMYKMAARHGVRYIISGGNLSTESIMPDIWMHDAKDLRFIKAIHRRFGTKPLKTFPLMSYTKLAWYILLRRIRYVSVLNYIHFDKEMAMQVLEQEMGWRKYEAKHFESIYTRFFQGYLLPQKFKMDKRRPHFSSLIVSGQMSRDEALEQLKNAPYDPNVAKEDIVYIRHKFGLSEEQFNEILNAPIKHSDNYPNSEKLLKRFTPVVRIIKNIATGRRTND